MIFARFTGNEEVSNDDAMRDALLKKYGEIKTKRPPSNA